MGKISKVLLTGFEPFWGYPRNVSQMAVQKITESGSYPFQVVGRILPTSFKKAPEVMTKAFTEIKPEITLSFGLLENISAFRIERIGLNINDAVQADNDGDKPAHRYILPDGPVGYEVNLPFAKIAAGLEKAGLPVEVSYHAQTFVCNHLIYTTMHLITTERLPILYGFIHLPNLPEDVKEMPIGTPCMPFETVLKGLDAILRSLSL
jgi:pyroglutamyl-peptidase